MKCLFCDLIWFPKSQKWNSSGICLVAQLGNCGDGNGVEYKWNRNEICLTQLENTEWKCLEFRQEGNWRKSNSQNSDCLSQSTPNKVWLPLFLSIKLCVLAFPSQGTTGKQKQKETYYLAKKHYQFLWLLSSSNFFHFLSPIPLDSFVSFLKKYWIFLQICFRQNHFRMKTKFVYCKFREYLKKAQVARCNLRNAKF